MKSTPVVLHLRKRVPVFGNRVAGALEFDPTRDGGKFAMPAAYVVMVADEVDPPMAQTSYIQTVRDCFDVYVAIAMVDETGGSRVDFLHDIRADLLRALAGWEPMPGYESLQYEGGELALLDRSRLIYRYGFSAEFTIGRSTKRRSPGDALPPPETWHEVEHDGLPDLERMHIAVDAIDPMVDRNIRYPGPDGRIEMESFVEFPYEEKE